MFPCCLLPSPSSKGLEILALESALQVDSARRCSLPVGEETVGWHVVAAWLEAGDGDFLVLSLAWSPAPLCRNHAHLLGALKTEASQQFRVGANPIGFPADDFRVSQLWDRYSQFIEKRN